MPTNYFVDSTTGDNADNGTTMDLAWATIEHAVEAGGLVAGDIVWVRRIHVEFAGNPISDIAFGYRGTPKLPIKLIGWCRNSHAVISSDWTNGSTTVVIDDADMSREKHCGRYITAPDGDDYLITKVTDASHIIIDREYVGSTVANQAATIKADEDYALAQAINDSGWTIKKTDYNADADDLPCIDFKNTAYKFNCAADYCWEFRNLELRDADTVYGVMTFDSGRWWSFIGCLFHQDNNRSIIRFSKTSLIFKRCILEGNGVGSVQYAFTQFGSTTLRLIDCAVYNFGGYAFYASDGQVFLENVNIGVEIANGNKAFVFSSVSSVGVFGRNVKIAGAVAQYYTCSITYASFENYQKVLGAHKIFNTQGEITKVAADGSGVSPNQRADGAANIVEILYNAIGANDRMIEPTVDFALDVFVHEFDVDTSTKTYRYYVQSMADLTADQLWIELEYISAYDGTSKYVIKKVKSDEAVAVRADQNDWTQYIEIPDITPAIASRIRITCKCSYHHATNKIFIDPGDFKYLPISLPRVDYPAIGDVEKDVNFDFGAKTGTFKKPAEADVEKDIQYGEDDVEFTGTLKVPAQADVRDGEGYGAGDNEFTGQLDLPLEADVEDGVKYDSLNKEGTLEVPIENNVRKPIGYGAAGSEFTGKAVVPAKADVRKDVEVDVSDLGLLDLPVIGDVEKDVQFDNLTKTGTFKVPTEPQVEKDVQYGAAGTEFTGSMVKRVVWKADAVGKLQKRVSMKGIFQQGG